MHIPILLPTLPSFILTAPLLLPILFPSSSLGSPFPRSHPTAPKNEIKWINCASAVPSPASSSTFNVSNVDLGNLPESLKCGTLDVPMDYSKPMCEGNVITLGLAMVRRVGSKGVLFFNPGGSDAGVVVAWDVALGLTQAFDGLEDWDLLVMDVRGTYSSNQLNVSLDTLTPLFGPYPTNTSAFATMKEASATSIQSWINNSTPPGIIEFVGTKEVVRDYEEVRRALGYEKINWLGASYGSFRAQQYAATYPERVDRFALDSVAPHGRPFFQQAQDTIAATNRIMQRADAYCMNWTSCPFHGQGKGAVIENFKTLLSLTTTTPILVPQCVNNPLCYPYITAHDIQFITDQALQGAPDFPGILLAIYAALNGDPSAFINGPLTLEEVVALPLLCGDYEFERSWEAFEGSLEAGLKSDITGIGQSQTWLIQLFCSSWPFPVPPSLPLPISTPMLLVTADFDPSAPTEWTTFARSQIPSSTLIVRHGDDHVSFLLTNVTSTTLTKSYLNTGLPPSPQDNDEFTTVYPPGVQRGAIADPYTVPTGPEAGDVGGGVVVEIPF